MSHIKYIFSIATVLFLVTTALPIWAQSDSAPQTCSVQMTLTELAPDGVSRVEFATVNPELILMLDYESSTSVVKYYDVRGFGSYSAPVDGTTGLGRFVIMTGRFSDRSSDPQRILDVRFVSGPLRGSTIYRILVGVIDFTTGDVKGDWWEVDNPPPFFEFDAEGTTDCLVEVM